MSDESSDGPTDGPRDVADEAADEGPTDDEVVRTAAKAAEGVVFAHYDQSA